MGDGQDVREARREGGREGGKEQTGKTEFEVGV